MPTRHSAIFASSSVRLHLPVGALRCVALKTHASRRGVLPFMQAPSLWGWVHIVDLIPLLTQMGTGTFVVVPVLSWFLCSASHCNLGSPFSRSDIAMMTTAELCGVLHFIIVSDIIGQVQLQCSVPLPQIQALLLVSHITTTLITNSGLINMFGPPSETYPRGDAPRDRSQSFSGS